MHFWGASAPHFYLCCKHFYRIIKPMRLLKYRDAQMKDYIWFWVNSREEQCSPSFDSEPAAQEWMEELIKVNYDWKPNRDIV